MSDQPLAFAVLAQFYREVVLLDIERTVGEAFARYESRMHANFDAVLNKLDKMTDRSMDLPRR